MLGRRFLSFLFETFILLPISLVINFGAIMPIAFIGYMLNTDGVEFTNVLFFGLPLSFVVGWGVAFFLNKLRLRIKGKTTDEYYEVEYQRVTSRVVDRYYGYGIETRVHNGTRIESSNTGWGIIGIILCFVAFPLQLVASLASFIALFVPVIYSTSRRLPNGLYFSAGNRMLHILFDFVIIPYFGPRLTPKFDQKSILWTLGYILTPVAAIFLGALIPELVEPRYLAAIAVPCLLALLFSLCATLVIVIKYTVLTLCFYDGERCVGYIKKIALSSLATGLLLVIVLIFL